MENASEALKIAFGLFVFITAITLLFVMTSNTRNTADVVLAYADDTNYYDHMDVTGKNRQVGVSDVITTLYRYYKESMSVTINWLDGATPKSATFDLQNEQNKDIDEIEKKLGDFINDNLINHPEKRFTETFLEIPTSGIYIVDSEGGELALSAGSKKIYITYDEEI